MAPLVGKTTAGRFVSYRARTFTLYLSHYKTLPHQVSGIIQPNKNDFEYSYPGFFMEQFEVILIQLILAPRKPKKQIPRGIHEGVPAEITGESIAGIREGFMIP